MSELWQQCLVVLKKETQEVDYKQWLKPLTASIKGDTLVLSAINSFFVKHIEKHYLAKIEQVIASVSHGQVVQVKIELMQWSEPVPTKSVVQASVLDESDEIDPTYTFDNFVKGKSNALAYSACWDMAKKAEQSTHAFVFIYGVSGVGKSHLMHSVAHRYQRGGKSFCYFTADGFMDKLNLAFKTHTIADFKKNVASADLLIIDDVHIIQSSTKPKMADVLLGLHSEFVQLGKRVILASDRSPIQMQGFDARFLSRFSGGLTVCIDPPELDVCVQILEKKAQALGFSLPKECAIFIAQNVKPEGRTFEGAVRNIKAQMDLMGVEGPLDIEMVSKAIRGILLVRSQSLSAESIKEAVAEYFGISVKDLVGKKRLRAIARPRQIAMALTREFTKESFPDIGQAFGGRDHTTVMHACDKVAELLQTDPMFQKDYQALFATLRFN